MSLQGSNFSATSLVYFNGQKVISTFLNSSQLTAQIPASSLPGTGSIVVVNPGTGGGTTAPLFFTAYVGIPNNGMVYNPANGLFYLSVPSSAGAPYGNCVVSIDPLTGALGKPIFVGSEPTALAITADGKYLWVGLNGASAVRQVDLTTNIAGLQFSLGGNGGIYDNPGVANSLAAVPGAPNSVIVSASAGAITLAIYDNGVLRGPTTTAPSFSASAIQVNSALAEVYASNGYQYNVYGYSASGLTLKKSYNSANYIASYPPEMQVSAGKLFNDLGTVYDAELGTLLGTFYSSGSNAAIGPSFADLTLGKAFILDTSVPYSSANQIQIFNPATFLPTTTSVIPISLAPNQNNNPGPTTLRRWGTNGLAFRDGMAFYSLRSNLVKNVSSVNADLGLTISASGTGTTGSNTTYTVQVKNAGPAGATNVAMTGRTPSTGVVLSATPTAGTCATTSGLVCDLKNIPSGATVTVTVVVQQLSAGTSMFSAQVAGSEKDPNLANNQATATGAVTGATYNLAPTLLSISPSAIQTASATTMITVTGLNFGSAAAISIDGTALATTVVSNTTATAFVPASKLAKLGWSKVSIANPAPGGGRSLPLPLSVFQVLSLDANHIVFDPYSRKIMASVGSSTPTGNSIAAITPETGLIGKSVFVGSQPTNLALTSDGQILYAVLQGSESVARFKMLTQTLDFTFPIPNDPSFNGGVALRGIAAQPGTENTIALDIAAFSGNALYDINPTTKTAAIRGRASGPYSGSCIHFLDAGDMLAFDIDTSGSTLDHYTVTPTGWGSGYPSYTSSTLNRFGCFQLSGGLAFANNGGVANPGTVPATQVGIYQPIFNTSYYFNESVAPDTSLKQVYYLGATTPNASYADGINVYNQNTFMPTLSIPLNMSSIENGSTYNGVDLIRWGQDGLALLTSTGHIYLVRGGAVVPSLLKAGTAAVLTSSSSSSIAHGSGNTVLALTGSNFQPGVAVTWNGSYRTTTVIDSAHVTVAIPASDLVSSGTGKLVAINPGSTASAALSITVN